MSDRPDLEQLLIENHDRLTAFVDRNTGAALRKHETIDDLVQGAQAEALRSADGFEYRSQPEFEAWLLRVARNYIYKRAAHHQAAKRGGGDVLHLIETEGGGLLPPDTITGPATRADRAERLALVARAMERMKERDREILETSAAGASIEDIATRFDLNYESAKKARARAFERVKKICLAMLEAGES